MLHLRSRLSDSASGATGTAIFLSRTLSDGSVDSKLIVNVRGAAAGSTLDVAIDGTVVGTIDTDANGNGHAVLTNVSVTPTAGSAISVDTTITGTLDVKGLGPAGQWAARPRLIAITLNLTAQDRQRNYTDVV